MSKESNKGIEIKGVTPSIPDGSLRGVHVGDPAGEVKGSYKPPKLESPPPAPIKKK